MAIKGNLRIIFNAFSTYNYEQNSTQESDDIYIAMLKTDQSLDHGLYYLQPMKVKIVKKITGINNHHVKREEYFNIKFPEDYKTRSHYGSDDIYIASDSYDDLEVEYQKLIKEWQLDKMQKMHEKEITMKLRFEQYLVDSEKVFNGLPKI